MRSPGVGAHHAAQQDNNLAAFLRALIITRRTSTVFDTTLSISASCFTEALVVSTRVGFASPSVAIKQNVAKIAVGIKFLIAISPSPTTFVPPVVSLFPLTVTLNRLSQVAMGITT